MFFRSARLGLFSTTSALARPHCFRLFLAKDIYISSSTWCVMNLNWSLLFVSITVVILILWCFDSVLDLIAKLAVLLVALWLPIVGAWARWVVVPLIHIIPIAVLVGLLIILAIVWLLGLRLLLLAITSTDRPWATTTWFVMDLHTSLIVFWVIVLVHLWLPVVLGSLLFFFGCLLGSVKFPISLFWRALIHFKNQLIILTTI